MKAKVLTAIKQNNLLSAGDQVTVGLSGGADSVALLCVLKELEKELSISVSACHVNHNLRGSESDRDESFCKELCKRMDIPFGSVSVDVRGYCDAMRLSIEEGARKLRYDALLERCKGGKLATAHTLSDNAETVIINLIRGSALDGLCGIPPVRENIIRPLIGCSRKDVEDYLKVLGQHYVTDSSNLTDDYRRNKIRHHIIPQLKDFNPSFEETIGRMSRALRDDKELLNSMAAKALADAELDCEKNISDALKRLDSVWNVEKRYDREVLLRQEPPIRMRCIRMMLGEFDISADSRRLGAIDKILLCGSGSENLAANTVFGCKEDYIYILKSFDAQNIKESSIEISADMAGFKMPLSDKYNITIRELSEKEIKLFVNNKSLQFKNAIDCDKIGSVITLRNRIPGDRYRPMGRSCTQTFKNIFNSVSLPLSVRDSLAVLTDQTGVIWLEGFGVSHSAKLTKNTHRAILVNISEE